MLSQPETRSPPTASHARRYTAALELVRDSTGELTVPGEERILHGGTGLPRAIIALASWSRRSGFRVFMFRWIPSNRRIYGSPYGSPVPFCGLVEALAPPRILLDTFPGVFRHLHTRPCCCGSSIGQPHRGLQERCRLRRSRPASSTSGLRPHTHRTHSGLEPRRYGGIQARLSRNRSSRPILDRAGLTAHFDLAAACDQSPSFAKLWRDVESLLLEQIRAVGQMTESVRPDCGCVARTTADWICHTSARTSNVRL
jgi:hypothetical protein